LRPASLRAGGRGRGREKERDRERERERERDYFSVELYNVKKREI
jgi:hypothetical protein